MIYRCDLTKQYAEYRTEIQDAVRRVLDSGRYVLANELNAFEKEFADYCATSHCIGVANGTDALILALKVIGIKQGDEIITTPFTAIPTVSAIVWVGGVPKFADIDKDTFCIDPAKIKRAITAKTKAILPVHLFGQAADIESIMKIGTEYGLDIIEDAAQSHGSLFNGKKTGTFGKMGCFSFYPTKNLGGYGDGGAIVTNDDDIGLKLNRMRNYGQTSPYIISMDGTNTRLDELQAAVLRIKLKHLDSMNNRRTLLAEEYARQLAGTPVQVPVLLPHTYHNHHVYVVRVPKRNELQSFLEQHNIQSNVYYPIGHHLQIPYKRFGYRKGDFPMTEKACDEVLALPFYPELQYDVVAKITQTIREFYSKYA